MAETILGALRKEILKNEEDLKETVASGAVNDYAEFRHLRGVLRGLRTALVLIDNMEKALKEGEDDD